MIERFKDSVSSLAGEQQRAGGVARHCVPELAHREADARVRRIEHDVVGIDLDEFEFRPCFPECSARISPSRPPIRFRKIHEPLEGVAEPTHDGPRAFIVVLPHPLDVVQRASFERLRHVQHHLEEGRSELWTILFEDL